jgi:hypothetical protein
VRKLAITTAAALTALAAFCAWGDPPFGQTPDWESGDGRVNCLPITEGWNYIVRMYQPRAEILEGKYVFPNPEPVAK